MKNKLAFCEKKTVNKIKTSQSTSICIFYENKKCNIVFEC